LANFIFLFLVYKNSKNSYNYAVPKAKVIFIPLDISLLKYNCGDGIGTGFKKFQNIK
jgi:hypothetical protein